VTPLRFKGLTSHSTNSIVLPNVSHLSSGILIGYDTDKKGPNFPVMIHLTMFELNNFEESNVLILWATTS